MSADSIKSKNLLEAIQKGREDEVEARLSLGEDVNSVFVMNRTPLHCAVANKMTRIVDKLLKHKPDITMTDSNGYTCLHVSCSRRDPDSHQILEMLLAAGAELNPLNKFGRTPLEEAVINDNFYAANILVKAGARVPPGARKMAEEKRKEEFIKLFREVSNSESESDPSVEGAASLPPPQLTVAQEKEALLKRLAELEEKEKLDLESQLREKKEQLEMAQKDFSSQKDKVQKALDKLDSQVTALRSKLSNLNREEGQKVKTLQLEISKLTNEISKRKVKESLSRDVEGCLDCPVCLDVCKPPTQIWQCPEGHIVCQYCADRPELTICPQCRVPLSGQMSRNRALEELARRTFPEELEAEEAGPRRSAGRGRPLQARGAPNNRSRASRFRFVQNQVDQLINFTSLNMSDEDYIWRSESFLESDEDDDDDDVTPDMPSSSSLMINHESGRTYFDDEEENDDEDLDEDEFFSNPPTPGLVPRSPVEGVPRPYGAWAAQRRGHRRRSPIMARAALRSPPRGNREPRESARAPPSGQGPFSRGGGERGRRNSRARGQWGRPSDLRFLR